MPGQPNVTPEQFELLVAEKRRRVALREAKAGLSSPLVLDLFPKQRLIFEDDSRDQALLGTRRGGKTNLVSRKLLRTAMLNPRNDCLYMNLTQKQAEGVMWDGPGGLLECNERYDLGGKADNQKLTLHMPNGARVFCGGAENKRDIEVWRGYRFKLICVDEAGSFPPHLEPLITSVLQPTTADLQGTIMLVGNPGLIVAGLFFEATREDSQRNTAWNFHRLGILDNPHMKDARTEMDRVRRVNGWDKYFAATGKEHPTFQREWLGKWVREDSTLIYHMPEDGRCFYTERPEPAHPGWQRILSIDLGYSADSAFRVIWFNTDLSPHAYLGRRVARKQMTPTAIAETIRKLEREEGDFVSIVADTGGLGVTIVAELNERHGFAIRAAEKKSKAAFVEMMNDDLAMGMVKVREDDPIVLEWANLQWADADRKIEDPRQADHESDAALYGWRESKHFTHVHVEPPPKEGEPGYDDHMARQIEQQIIAQQQGQAGQPWWERYA